MTHRLFLLCSAHRPTAMIHAVRQAVSANSPMAASRASVPEASGMAASVTHSSAATRERASR